MQKYQDVIQRTNGQAVVGASVAVQTYPAGVAATIYSDNSGTVATNPLTTDSLGNFSFYAANGRYQLVISGAGITTRTQTDVELYDEVSVLDYGGVCDGTTSDTTAWQAAVTAIQTAGGGVITAPAGRTTVLDAAVLITASNVKLSLNGVTVKLTGSASFAGFDFGSTSGFIGAPVLSSNAAIYAKSLTLSSLGGLVAGGWLKMQKDAPNNGGAAQVYTFMVKVKSITGSGPYTANLASRLPVAFNTADAGLAIAYVSMLSNCGIEGQATFDGSAATGTTVHGVKAIYLERSKFDSLHFTGFDTGAGLWAQFGHGNVFEDCTAEASGNASFDALFYVDQTAAVFSDQRTLNGTGFGIQYAGCVYCTATNTISEGSVAGRGIKIAASLENTFTNNIGEGNDYNGLAVSIGSCRNTFIATSANGNDSSEGVWLSDQYNIGNKFIGVVAGGNGSRDIYVGTTDTANTFIGVRTAGVFYVNNATTVVLDWNGNSICGGASGNQPKVVLADPDIAVTTSYANDAAAAAGGVTVGKMYRNGSVVQVRVV